MSASRIFRLSSENTLQDEELIPEPIMLTSTVLLEISVFPPSPKRLG